MLHDVTMLHAARGPEAPLDTRDSARPATPCANAFEAKQSGASEEWRRGLAEFAHQMLEKGGSKTGTACPAISDKCCTTRQETLIYVYTV